MTLEYVLYELSYENLTLYSAVLPSYNSDIKKGDSKTIDADDPKNRDAILKILS